MCPFTGRTSGPAPGQTRDVGQADPSRQDDLVRTEAAAVRQDERRPGRDGGHAALLEGDAGRRRQASTRAPSEGAVVDLVVAGHVDAAAQRRAERRYELTALAGAAAVRLEAERVLVGEEVVEAGAVGCIERDGERARRVVPDGVTAGRFERSGERRPAAGAFEQQRGQGGLAELRLGDRGEHPGRHPRRAVAAGRRRDHRHFMTVA